MVVVVAVIVVVSVVGRGSSTRTNYVTTVQPTRTSTSRGSPTRNETISACHALLSKSSDFRRKKDSRIVGRQALPYLRVRNT